MLLYQEAIISVLNKLLHQVPKIRKGTDAVYHCPSCKHYKRYLMQGIIARNVIGYIPKHQTYTQENIQQDIPPTPSEDVKEEESEQKTQGNDDKTSDENENSEDLSEDVQEEKPIDPIKLMKIAVALDKKPWVKNDPNKKLIE